jgi:hypothetical protein
MPSTPVRLAESRVSASQYIVESPAPSGLTDRWFEAGSLTQGVPGAAAQKVTPGRSRTRHSYKVYVLFYGGKVDVFTSW